MLTREGALAARERVAWGMHPDTGQLRYHGGPVQTSPSIYVVFWGFRSDPAHEAQTQTAFLRAVAGSSWLGTVAQYYSTNPIEHITNASAQLRATWYDNVDAVPLAPTDAQIAAEAVLAAEHFAALDSNATYIVDTPQGNSSAGFAQTFCAYHGATVANGVPIAYVDFPYVTDGGRACGAFSVNRGRSGLTDGITIVTGHELAEAQTDPDTVSGWIDWTNQEIADKCLWLNLQNTKLAAGATFPTQPLWSDALPGCAQ